VLYSLVVTLTYVYSDFEHVEKRGKTEISVFTDDSATTSPEKLIEGSAQNIQKPDNDSSLLSALRYLHTVADAALCTLPSTRYALAKQTQHHQKIASPQHTYLQRWTLCGLLSRQSDSSNAKDVSSFVLRMVVVMSTDFFKIGPCNEHSTWPAYINLNIDLRLQPKASLFPAFLDECAKEPKESVTHVATELLNDLRQSLGGREFTSGVSVQEAFVTQLKEHFRHTQLERYLELQGISIVSDGKLPKQGHLRWVHETPHMEAITYNGLHGKDLFPGLSKGRPVRSLEVTGKSVTSM